MDSPYSQVQWGTPVSLVPWKQRQEDRKFEASLHCLGTLFQNDLGHQLPVMPTEVERLSQGHRTGVGRFGSH